MRFKFKLVYLDNLKFILLVPYPRTTPTFHSFRLLSGSIEKGNLTGKHPCDTATQTL